MIKNDSWLQSKGSGTIEKMYKENAINEMEVFLKFLQYLDTLSGEKTTKELEDELESFLQSLQSSK